MWFLVSVPCLIVVMAIGYETTEVSQTAGWFQEAVNRAAKAAAYQVSPPSYSVGLPTIDPVKGDAAFRSLLAHNLSLGPVDLKPTERNSRIAGAPEYNLFVYNGPFPYTFQNAEYGISTVLNEPTVVAMVKIKFAATVRNTNITIRRYAIAKVVKTTP